MPRQSYSVPKFREEFACKKVGFHGENPQRFAKTEWTKTQGWYVIYRTIWFLYSAVVLMWKCYQTSLFPNHSDLDMWFSHYATWTFILFTFYHCLALLLTVLNFLPDLLCNDDFVWYHKVSWFCCSVTYSATLLVCLSSITGFIASAVGDEQFNALVKVFKSNEVNFYAIPAVLMMFEIVICGFGIRLLHMMWSQFFLIFYYLYHGCRYAAGYGAQYTALDFGANNIGRTAGFILITVLIVIPLLHFTGFMLSRTKTKVIYGMKKRARRRKFLLSRRSNLLSSSTEGGATEQRTISNSNTSSSGYFVSSTFLQSRETTPGRRTYWTNRVYPRHPPIYEV